MEFNSVYLSGIIANDLDELRTTRDGRSVINFSIACWKENDRSSADFIQCSAFGKIAENIARYLKKNSHVTIEGRICSDINHTESGNYYNMFVLIKKIQF